jgi:hypothetical protein
MRLLLQAARSKISISVDIWTSSNHLSFLRVVAHLAAKLELWLLPTGSVASHWLAAKNFNS